LDIDTLTEKMNSLAYEMNQISNLMFESSDLFLDKNVCIKHANELIGASLLVREWANGMLDDANNEA
jgi:hypothetical protein